jgi:hypothetical protein
MRKPRTFFILYNIYLININCNGMTLDGTQIVNSRVQVIHTSEEKVPDHETIIQVRRAVRNWLFTHQPSFVDSVTE